MHGIKRKNREDKEAAQVDLEEEDGEPLNSNKKAKGHSTANPASPRERVVQGLHGHDNIIGHSSHVFGQGGKIDMYNYEHFKKRLAQGACLLEGAVGSGRATTLEEWTLAKECLLSGMANVDTVVCLVGEYLVVGSWHQHTPRPSTWTNTASYIRYKSSIAPLETFCDAMLQGCNTPGQAASGIQQLCSHVFDKHTHLRKLSSEAQDRVSQTLGKNGLAHPALLWWMKQWPSDESEGADAASTSDLSQDALCMDMLGVTDGNVVTKLEHKHLRGRAKMIVGVILTFQSTLGSPSIARTWHDALSPGTHNPFGYEYPYPSQTTERLIMRAMHVISTSLCLTTCYACGKTAFWDCNRLGMAKFMNTRNRGMHGWCAECVPLVRERILSVARAFPELAAVQECHSGRYVTTLDMDVDGVIWSLGRLDQPLGGHDVQDGWLGGNGVFNDTLFKLGTRALNDPGCQGIEHLRRVFRDVQTRNGGRWTSDEI